MLTGKETSLSFKNTSTQDNLMQITSTENERRSIDSFLRDDYDNNEETENKHLDSQYSSHSRKSIYDLDSFYPPRDIWEDHLDGHEDREYEDQGIYHDIFSYQPIGVSLQRTNRDEIIEKLKELQHEANVLVIKNKFLHRKYIEVMQKSLNKNALNKFDEITVFQDSGYFIELEDYARQRDKFIENESSLNEKLKSLKEERSKAESEFEKAFEKLFFTVLDVAKVNKPIKLDKQTWLDRINKMLENQRHRLESVAKLRMIYIKLLYKLNKMRSHGLYNLGPGFSVLDYEFLLKKKNVYIEKRDEQQDSIIKLNHKNLATAAIIKHVDEETDFYGDKLKNEAERLDALLGENKIEHSKFVKLAKARAVTFKSILKLRENIGILGVPFLIDKMEYDIVELERLTNKLVNLETKFRMDENRQQQIKVF